MKIQQKLSFLHQGQLIHVFLLM